MVLEYVTGSEAIRDQAVSMLVDLVSILDPFGAGALMEPGLAEAQRAWGGDFRPG